jgi:hypothetical protein
MKSVPLQRRAAHLHLQREEPLIVIEEEAPPAMEVIAEAVEEEEGMIVHVVAMIAPDLGSKITKARQAVAEGVGTMAHQAVATLAPSPPLILIARDQEAVIAMSLRVEDRPEEQRAEAAVGLMIVDETASASLTAEDTREEEDPDRQTEIAVVINS